MKKVSGIILVIISALLISLIFIGIITLSGCDNSKTLERNITYYIKTMDNKTIELTNEDIEDIRHPFNNWWEFDLSDGSVIGTSIDNITMYEE